MTGALGHGLSYYPIDTRRRSTNSFFPEVRGDQYQVKDIDRPITVDITTEISLHLPKL
jgi:hypothetical protein